jgi:hypothetical protein
MAKVKAQVLKPEGIEITLEATFTLGEWRKIRSALDRNWIYPMCDLADAIKDCTDQAESVFIPKIQADDPS